MPAVDYATKYAGARQRLLVAMSDLRWRSCKEMEELAGNRYGARIRELRRLGYVIEDRDEDDGKSYRLVSAAPSSPRGKKVRVYLEECDAADLVRGRVTLFAQAEVAGALGRFRANKERL